MCRYGTRQLSALKPKLDAADVRLAAVGLERLGVEDFLAKGYFTGELYIDENKKCYEDLGYKRFNFVSIWAAIVSAISRRTISNARREGIDGNLRGDGLQNGGLLIVERGGQTVLLSHREEVPGDHVPNSKILRVLGIKGDSVEKPDGSDSKQ